MSLSRRLRNIALTQLNALKDRLDHIDAEAEAELGSRRAEADARRELDDPVGAGPRLRTPEEIAGAPRSEPGPRPTITRSTTAAQTTSGPLSAAYRVLGLEDGADYSAVQAAYATLSARCSPDRFTEGSEEQAAAREIFKRVDAAYGTLRDALDPTAGRFDKLEL